MLYSKSFVNGLRSAFGPPLARLRPTFGVPIGVPAGHFSIALNFFLCQRREFRPKLSSSGGDFWEAGVKYFTEYHITQLYGMRFISDSPVEGGRKISFSDIDDWGRTSRGVVFMTDPDYNVRGLELYSARFGIMRFDGAGAMTYCHGWEKDQVKQGIGVSSHFATKLIDNAKESHELFDNIYGHITSTLKFPSLGQAISEVLLEKRQIKLNLDSLKSAAVS